MPDVFTPFKNAVERNCPLPPPLPAPLAGQLPLPADTSQLDLGFAPSLEQLPWATAPPEPAGEGGGPSAFSWRGGETTALARVEEYLFETDAVATYATSTLVTAPSAPPLSETPSTCRSKVPPLT